MGVSQHTTQAAGMCRRKQTRAHKAECERLSGLQDVTLPGSTAHTSMSIRVMASRLHAEGESSSNSNTAVTHSKKRGAAQVRIAPCLQEHRVCLHQSDSRRPPSRQHRVAGLCHKKTLPTWLDSCRQLSACPCPCPCPSPPSGRLQQSRQ
jgi:hypothetical protein